MGQVLILILAILLGIVLSMMGYNVTNWQFWVVLLIANGMYVAGLMRGRE